MKMERRTPDGKAYKTRKTLQRKIEGYTRIYMQTFNRLPKEAEYPQYTFLPMVEGLQRRPDDGASSAETRRETADDDETKQQQRHAIDDELSNNGNSDDDAASRMSVNENEMCESEDDDVSDEMNVDEISQVTNNGNNEAHERYRGNFDSNTIENDGNSESEHSDGEIEVTDESSSNEETAVNGDENDDSNHGDDIDNNDVDGNENGNDDAAAPLPEERRPIVTMRDEDRKTTMFITVIAMAVRHVMSVIAILSFFKFLNRFERHKMFPKKKRTVRKRLGIREDSFQTRHLYCRKCLNVIGTGKLPIRDCYCEISGPGKPLKTVGFFITLNLIGQMKKMLSIPDFIKLLRYPHNRKRSNGYDMEDIYDGMAYKNLQKPGRFLSNEWNFSFTLNTDGCQVAKSSGVSAWPILLTINELPPHARKRFMILAGIWVDRKHPDLNTFMRPVVEQLHGLYNTGIDWKPNGRDTVRSKFITIICCVDSLARASVLNMTRFNGKYGCHVCYMKGQRCRINSLVWVYPTIGFQHRTDEDMRSDMEIAMNSNSRVRGFIGNSILRYIPEFDLHEGVVIDSMHNMWLGVGKTLTQMLLNAKTTDPWYIRSKKSLESLINRRLTRIRTPSRIARKPRGIDNCNVWKANEWRNWITYYCLPCLKDVIPDEYFKLFCRLSEVAHILNNECIDTQNIRRARLLIEFFVEDYQQLMGLHNMTYNLHILRHVPDFVINWGPLWTHTAFIYEGYNRQMLLSLKSPNSRQVQIMNYYILNDYIRNIKNEVNLDHEVQEMMNEFLNMGLRRKKTHYDEYWNSADFEGLGYRVVREPSATEVTLLQNEDQRCNGELNIYKQANIRGVTYVSDEGDTGNARSCDKYIFTKGELFAKIDAIIAFVNDENTTIYGAFVTYMESTGIYCEAEHIFRLIESTTGFVKTDDGFTPATMIVVNNEMYGVKMTNVWETD